MLTLRYNVTALAKVSKLARIPTFTTLRTADQETDAAGR